MATLKIKKKTSKIWVHEPSDINIFILSKFYIKSDGDYIQIVEQGGVQRAKYIFSDVKVYDIGGIAETFTSVELLMKRLEALNYTGFFYDGEVIPATLISSDLNNGLVVGSDGKLYSSLASNSPFIIKDEIVCTDVATNYYFRVNASGTSYTPVATSGTSPDFVTSLGQTNAYRYVDSFTLPYAVKLNKIVVIINNEFTYSFTLSFGYHLKNNATNSVSNPTSILEAAINKGSYRRFYREYNSADFGNVTIPANHSLITGWFLQGFFINIYFEIEKI